MLDVIRWLLFLPAAFAASVVASALFTISVRMMFSEFVAFSTGGAMAAVTFIIAGLWVAPRKNNAVKWSLIAISAILGILSAAGAMLGDDRLKVTTGVCMVLASLGFARMPPHKITRVADQALQQTRPGTGASPPREIDPAETSSPPGPTS